MNRSQFVLNFLLHLIGPKFITTKVKKYPGTEKNRIRSTKIHYVIYLVPRELIDSTRSVFSSGTPGFHFIVPKSRDTVDPRSGAETPQPWINDICLKIIPYQHQQHSRQHVFNIDR